MHTFRHITGAPGDLLFPVFRNINFSDDGAVVVVSQHLRLAWLALSPPDPADISKAGIGAWMRTNTHRTELERAAVPQNPDVRRRRDADAEVEAKAEAEVNVYTPWREASYEMWNHVFQDVSNFLQDVGAGMGHLHPPAQEVFTLPYPANTGLVEGEVGEKETEGNGTQMVWETDVLLIWVWLGDGVKVRMTTWDVVDEEEKTLGSFVEGTTETEIWYVRRGTKVRFYVEGEREGLRKGLAAVLVTGRLDLECPGKKTEADVEDVSITAKQEVASEFTDVVNLKEVQEEEHN